MIEYRISELENERYRVLILDDVKGIRTEEAESFMDAINRVETIREESRTPLRDTIPDTLKTGEIPFIDKI